MKPRLPPEHIPVDAMAEAKAIYALADEDAQCGAFNAVSAKLRTAFNDGDYTGREFWQLVFAAYVFLCGNARECRNLSEWHNANTAAMWADGFDPRS